MKTVVIGDLHGSDIWKGIIYKEEPNKVIFLGDYFDSFTYSANTQWHNFINILSFKDDHPEIEVILLVGNHDHHYLKYVGNSGTSGYNKAWSLQFGEVLMKADLKMAYQQDNILFSHAGISHVFLSKYYPNYDVTKVADYINELFYHKPLVFKFNTQASDPYGDDVFQSPIWIREKSLMLANKNTELKETYIQVYGHTVTNKIDTKGHHTGGKYYCIDTLNTSKEYMYIEDSQIKFNKWSST